MGNWDIFSERRDTFSENQIRAHFKKTLTQLQETRAHFQETLKQLQETRSPIRTTKTINHKVYHNFWETRSHFQETGTQF